jgi:hypothetical protein
MMKISEMTDIIKRAPLPIRMMIDRWGEKDPLIKKHVVGLDYALTSGMSDTTIRILIEDFLDYVERKYFIDRDKTRAKIVMFLADHRKK